MAELARAVASLRIIGEHLDPAQVSVLLGCQPTQGWGKGDTITSHRATRTARFGMWMLRADETTPADLGTQVTSILNRLTSDESVWAALSSEHDIDLFCGWFMEHGNEGVSIEPETMLALGARGIPVHIDLYGPDGETSPN